MSHDYWGVGIGLLGSFVYLCASTGGLDACSFSDGWYMQGKLDRDISQEGTRRQQQDDGTLDATPNHLPAP